MTGEESRPSINPTALSLADAARLLAKLGAPRVNEAMLRADVADGAPTNADGTINLVRYAAWLVQQMGRTVGEPDGR